MAEEAGAAAPKPGSDEEHPASVAWVANALRDWLRRLGSPWIEGQIAQLSPRKDMAFLTLRDLSSECSLPVYVPAAVLQRSGPLEAGQHVLVKANVDFWVKRGELQLRASAIRQVGIGELLAQLEKLKNLLEAEGLFRPERKRRLPFLPARVGLISGRSSDAERDVITNARRRWPGIEFEVRNTAVQGPRAVSEVMAALQELDRIGDVHVIVIARGGGSAEDLLPFSSETLVRAVAASSTPVVSAIGHERDNPILDHVADLRASTPTDAGKRIVPDYAEEVRLVRDLGVRSRRAITNLIMREQERLDAHAHRPVLARPEQLVERLEREVAELRGRAGRSVLARVDHDRTEIGHLRSRVRALSPAATLDRGYAVVQTGAGTVVRDPGQAGPGEHLRIRVAHGEFAAQRIEEEQ